MREAQRTTIDGWNYVVRPLPTSQGIALMARVGKLLGASLAALLRGGADGDVIVAAMDRLQPADLVEVAKELASTAVIGQPGAKEPANLGEVFDAHFAGDYLALFDFLKFAAEVNYGPFVAGLKRRATDRADALKAAAAAVAPSP